jgi:hypothetical protein
MSSRAAETLREDLESRGPMRLSEVEAQQKEILKTVRRLADEGQIVVGGGGATTPWCNSATTDAQSDAFIPGEEIDAVTQWDFGDVDAICSSWRRRSRSGRLRPNMAQCRSGARRGPYAEDLPKGAQGRHRRYLAGASNSCRTIRGQGRRRRKIFANLLESARRNWPSRSR